jgi:hypothetical protein
MSGAENFPEEAEHEEVEFTRAELGAFLRARGGCYVERTLDTVCPELCGLTFTELNFLMVGVCGKYLTEAEWDELIEGQESDDESEEEDPQTMSLNISVKLTEDGWTRSVEEVVDV